MTDHLWIVLLVVASVGSGLVGGLFFIFSNTIMRALDALPAAHAVAAMNSINRVILNPVFLLAFFGTALLCIGVLLGQLARASTLLVSVAALLYLVGSIGVTIVCNVPLNNKLAKLSPSATDLESQWRAYRGPWTKWNHVRTVTCLLAAFAFAISAAR